MRVISMLFIILGIFAFMAATLNRYGLVEIRNDPITLVEIAKTSLLFAISFGILSLKK